MKVHTSYLTSHCKSLVSHITYLAERRSAILNQILEPEAVDRLNRIRLVKEESYVVNVEEQLSQLARSGRLQQKITDEQLKQMLSVTRKTEEEQKLVVNRRKGGWDDDDDLLSGL